VKRTNWMPHGMSRRKRVSQAEKIPGLLRHFPVQEWYGKTKQSEHICRESTRDKITGRNIANSFVFDGYIDFCTDRLSPETKREREQSNDGESMPIQRKNLMTKAATLSFLQTIAKTDRKAERKRAQIIQILPDRWHEAIREILCHKELLR